MNLYLVLSWSEIVIHAIDVLYCIAGVGYPITVEFETALFLVGEEFMWKCFTTSQVTEIQRQTDTPQN